MLDKLDRWKRVGIFGVDDGASSLQTFVDALPACNCDTFRYARHYLVVS